jgi:hypothetical protein
MPRADPATTLTVGDGSRVDNVRPVEAPPTIVCVDCGGTCHLLSVVDAEDVIGGEGLAGIVAAYRCEDCLDRWDVELEPDDQE